MIKIELERISAGLTSALETYKGASIKIEKNLLDYNVISSCKNGKIKKIIIQPIPSNGKWITINGVSVIDKLFFEKDCWIYFVLYPENVVIATKGLKFIQTQLDISNTSDEIKELEQWLLLSKKLTKNNKFKFTPNAIVNFPIPVRKLYKNFEEYKEKFSDSVMEIWQNTKNGWQLIYKSNKYEEM